MKIQALSRNEVFETVLPLCTSLRRESKNILLDNGTATELAEKNRSMAAGGLRVIALAYRELEQPPEGGICEDSLVFAGFMGLEDPPRPEVPQALIQCRSAGIKVIMITGDAGPTAAAAIARDIGLITGDPVIIEGRECAIMPDTQLREELQKDNLIFARMSPQNKMHVVSLLIEDGHRVAVTGDGVNDAPALKKAHVGIAMGLSGTSVAREAADIVLLDDNFASIVHAIEEGRTVFENIRKFITYIFATSISELVPFIGFILFGIPLPLTIMQRPPRPKTEHLLTRGVLVRAYLFLGVFESLSGMCAYFYVMNAGGWHWPQALASTSTLYLQATTACLAGIIATQIANVFTCRSPIVSITTLGFFSNPLVLVGIACELAVTAFVIYTPAGNAIFGCAPIGITIWLLLIPFALLLLTADETRKYVVRRSIGPDRQPL